MQRERRGRGEREAWGRRAVGLTRSCEVLRGLGEEDKNDSDRSLAAPFVDRDLPEGGERNSTWRAAAAAVLDACDSRSTQLPPAITTSGSSPTLKPNPSLSPSPSPSPSGSRGCRSYASRKGPYVGSSPWHIFDVYG